MDEILFRNLVVVMAAAVAAPIMTRLIRKPRLPGPVVELILGVLIGPSLLNWAEVGPTVSIISTLGLAYLLFLAGLEIDLEQIRGPLYRLAAVGFVCSLAAAVLVGYGLQAVGVIEGAWFFAIVLSATSLSLIVPVLKEAGQLATPLGRLTLGEASVAEFGTVIVLSILFSTATSSAEARLTLAIAFIALVAAFAYSYAHAARSEAIARGIASLEEGTSQIRVRVTMLIVVGFAVVAQETGLEAILGALIAGGLVSLLDGGYLRTHQAIRSKLDAIGFGFLIPVFFVASGMQLDVNALRDDPSELILIPIVLIGTVAVRAVVVAIYRRELTSREATAAWILQSTLSLPFVVTATTIGRQLDVVDPGAAAALVATAMVSGLLFPALGLSLTPRTGAATETEAIAEA